jgi:hypothetical protein
MIHPWTVTLHASASDVKLLVKRAETGELMRARLPSGPQHPRALLTLLEGLALWQGGRLPVAIVADERCPAWSTSVLFGDELWPAESPLVRFNVALRGHRAGRLRGVGDFRALHAMARAQ